MTLQCRRCRWCVGAAARPNWREHWQCVGLAGRDFHVSTDSNAGGSIPVPRSKKLNARQRRALAILAGAGPRGCAEAILMAHGFPIEVLAGLSCGVGLLAPRWKPRPTARALCSLTTKRAACMASHNQYRIERDRGSKESPQQFAVLREKWPLAFRSVLRERIEPGRRP
jgi:hypothetical protein